MTDVVVKKKETCATPNACKVKNILINIGVSLSF